MELSESIVGEVNDLHTSSSKANELVLRQAYLTFGVEKQQNLDMSLELAVELGDSKQIWQWIQRSKARAFSTMLTGLRGGKAAHVDLGFGVDAPSFENLRWIQSASASRLVFVDWISYGFHSRQLLMYCCRIIDGDCCTHQFEIDTDLDVLKQAASKIKGARMNDSDAESYLRSFESVIEPLQGVCDPGEILILCPTAPFHNVPLHAVKLGVQVIIERNLIVYVLSQLALLHCVERLAAPKADMDAPSEWKALVTAAYSDESNETAIRKEREDIYCLSKELAADLDAEIILGMDLTSNAAAQHLQSADVFHFHGHGITDPHDPIKQCLALGELGSSLSMGDIASLDLASAHVTLIACSGAVQNFSFSLDEPLGLLSAFLLGGASSVIGALWPIRSETGRSFTRIFYEYFLKHLDRSELGQIVNLARALQHTVLELKQHDQTSLPYHWAPFICYGSWLCRRKPGTWQREAEEEKPRKRKRKGR